MRPIRPTLILALFTAAPALADNSSPPTEAEIADFSSFAASGNASRGQQADPAFPGNGCEKLAGMFDPGSSALSSATMWKDRNAQAKKLADDETKAAQAKYPLDTDQAAYVGACQYQATHQQDDKANAKLAAARDTFAKHLESFRNQLVAVFKDGKNLIELMNKEEAQRRQIAQSAPTTTDSQKAGIAALNDCRGHLSKSTVPMLQDSGKYASSLADGLKSCSK